MKLPRFYPIIDTGFLTRRGVSPLQVAEALAKAGAGIAQFRHKGPYAREVFQQARQIGQVLRGAEAVFVLNDRADIALMLGADAVHVGQEDLPPGRVRALVGGEMAIGFSTHNERQLRGGGAEAVDYLAIGPIFGTQSKEKPDPTLGLEELGRLRPLTDKPLVAIGGITRHNARDVLEAGADSVAVISDLIGEDLDSRIREWIEATSIR